ncbi:MAG TPA: SDR family NAD(P)-dependent oxidoreductase [Actinotalea sp.]|nr:SDR family NAD(P)-dependent oxidoreductase [Actinotalea sp.]
MTSPDRRPASAVPRTAVVTGAGRGIGAALARGLAAHGYDVALLGRTRAHLEAVADQILAGPGPAAGTGGGALRPPRVVVVPVELTDPAAVDAAAEQVRAGLGGVGLLVNNAGVIERAEVPFAQDDVEDTWRVIETNLRGPLLLTRALLPGMLAQGGGRVVNLNSGAGHRGSFAYTGYGISKGALARLTTMLDTQYRDRGLRVFDLAPGVVRTDMTAAMPLHEDRAAWTPVAAVTELLVALADGRLDALSGRFVRAGADTPTSLAEHTDEILAADARRLRLVAWGDGDPVEP